MAYTKIGILQALVAVFLIVVALHQFLTGSWLPRLEPTTKLEEKSKVDMYTDDDDVQLCFIIRTYWAHGPQGGDEHPPLLNMLSYLTKNSHTRWEALLLVMDRKPFHELPEIVEAFKDPRIKIFANKVGDSYAAKLPDGSWNPEYHDKLYSLTDEAIKACSPDTQWMVITNGDNEYDEAFIPRVTQVPTDVDIIAIDFYSRYQRVTAAPCERFEARPEAPPCKENLLRFCNTDLAAAIYRWPRFIAEDRAFSKMDSNGIGLNDGLLARLLRTSGWKVHRISDVCLLSHSPSPQLCALHGGVWDDSVYAMFQHSGGRCLDMEEAKELLRGDPDLEVLEVSVSHDGATFGFQKDKPVPLACIRRKFEGPFQNRFYPEQCAATIDGGIDY